MAASQGYLKLPFAGRDWQDVKQFTEGYRGNREVKWTVSAYLLRQGMIVATKDPNRAFDSGWFYCQLCNRDIGIRSILRDYLDSRHHDISLGSQGVPRLNQDLERRFGLLAFLGPPASGPDESDYRDSKAADGHAER